MGPGFVSPEIVNACQRSAAICAFNGTGLCEPGDRNRPASSSSSNDAFNGTGLCEPGDRCIGPVGNCAQCPSMGPGFVSPEIGVLGQLEIVLNALQWDRAL